MGSQAKEVLEPVFTHGITVRKVLSSIGVPCALIPHNIEDFSEQHAHYHAARMVRTTEGETATAQGGLEKCLFSQEPQSSQHDLTLHRTSSKTGISKSHQDHSVEWDRLYRDLAILVRRGLSNDRRGLLQIRKRR